MIDIIPLAKLMASKANARRQPADRAADDRLEASIRALGVLHNLVVVPNGTAGSFEVVAGARRLRALQRIHGTDADVPIPCEVREPEEGVEASLAENTQRLDMAPLDASEAFNRLVKAGKDTEEVAARFGVTERYVEQRLRLAGLHQDVKKALREGRLELGAASAFTLAPKADQKRAFDQLATSGWAITAHNVRRILLETWIDARHALFDVDGLPPSAVRRDLFGEEVYVERETFMARQWVAAEAKVEAFRAEGWSWVELAEAPLDAKRQARLARETAEPLPEVAAVIEALAKEHDEIQAKLEEIEAGSTLSELQAHECARLETRLEEIEDLIHGRRGGPAGFSDAQKQRCGVLVLVDLYGRVQVDAGLYDRKERERQVKAAVKEGRSDGAGTPAAVAAASEGVEEKAPRLDARQAEAAIHHLVLALRHQLADSARTAMTLVILALHDRIDAYDVQIGRGGKANATSSAVSAADAPDWELDANGAATALDQALAVHDVLRGERWSRIEPAEAFAKLEALPDADLTRLFALSVASTLTHAGTGARPSPLLGKLAQRLNPNLRAVWTPGARFLGRSTKAQLLAITHELTGYEPPASLAAKKKPELVAHVAAILAKARAEGFDDTALNARVNAWLPVNLRPGTTET